MTSNDALQKYHPRRAEVGTPRPRQGTRSSLDPDSGSRARWALTCIVLVSLTVFTLLGDTATDSEPARTSGTVDLAAVVQPTTRWSVGIGASTYGASVLTSPIEARNERRLAAATVRIPVSVRNGQVTSGAAGAGDVAVAQLVQRYLQWGYRVLVVIDAAREGDAVRPADARTIIATLGYGPNVQYSTSNEPDSRGRSLPTVIAEARMILRQGRSLHAGFRIWGPVWSSYNRKVFRTFAAALGNGLAGIDYHAYAMGQTSLTTAQAMARTPLLGQEVARTAADLHALKLHAGVSVDELNLTWRFADGTPGGNTRLLSAVNTVWLASACGHVLRAGGSCLPYANQNGPLGMLSEAGQIPRDRQPSTPLPGYWGIAAWTGAGLFPHMGDAFLSARDTVPGVEIFAVRNAAAGYNIVVIDKNQAPRTTTFALRLEHAGRGRYVPYTTDPAHPFDAPVAGPAKRYSTTMSLVVHAMTVTTLVLTPGT